MMITRMCYDIWSILFLFLLFIMCSVAFASNAGKGNYEPHNSKKLLLEQEKKIIVTGRFFTDILNRTPAHDTPASPCTCSKYIYKN